MGEVKAQHGFSLAIIESGKGTDLVVMAGRFGEADLRHQAEIDVDVPALKLDCSPRVGSLDLLRSAVEE